MENSRFIELYTELEIDIRRIYELRDNESPITYYLKEVITPRNEDALVKEANMLTATANQGILRPPRKKSSVVFCLPASRKPIQTSARR